MKPVDKRVTITLASVVTVTFLFLVFFSLTVSNFRKDTQSSFERIENLEGNILVTDYGPVEYGISGEGYPVLISHGLGGGFDQGLIDGEKYLSDAKMIAISRFGYLGSTMPQQASAALQADVYAVVLDSLNIEKAAVLGISTGATSAVQFALRHPERCSGLILISANLPNAPTPLRGFLANALLKSDYFFWFALKYSRPIIDSMLGITDAPVTLEDREDISRLVEGLLPIEMRFSGMVFDSNISAREIDGLAFENIKVPTLMIHTRDDALSPFVYARPMSAKISGSVFVEFNRGGHHLLGQRVQARRTIREFMKEKAMAN